LNRDTTRQIAVIIAYVATVVVNTLANALPINGQNTGEISDRFAIFFVPAGWVFAIWLPIYLLLGAYSIYQATRAQKTNPALRSIGWLFVLSCIFNIIWIFLWHYNFFPATLLFMIALLVTLIAIYQRLGIGLRNVPPDMFWLVHAPFSVYLGWITVATIANATQVLFYWGWNGFGIAPETWAVIMLAVATVVAALMAIRRRDVLYLLVLVWAFVGIAFKHAGTPPVAPAAWIAAAVVAVLAIYALASRAIRPAPGSISGAAS
jgi:hypothetical protein